MRRQQKLRYRLRLPAPAHAAASAERRTAVRIVAVGHIRATGACLLYARIDAHHRGQWNGQQGQNE